MMMMNIIVFRGMLELEQAVRRVMVTGKFSGRIIFHINLFVCLKHFFFISVTLLF
jgi:hypothetical protein